jgi:Flp pilus assembly protein TadG
MPICRTIGRRTRRGSTIVESALVLSIFLMFLFGIFEYSRFLMVMHLTNNAARDGARYAAVNLSKPSTFTTTNYTDASGNVYPSITSYVTSLMGGMDHNVQGFTVTVTARDQNGNVLSGTTWNSITFPQQVGVSVTGNYQPITPLLLFMSSSIPVNATAAVVSEG